MLLYTYMNKAIIVWNINHLTNAILVGIATIIIIIAAQLSQESVSLNVVEIEFWVVRLSKKNHTQYYFFYFFKYE